MKRGCAMDTFYFSLFHFFLNTFIISNSVLTSGMFVPEKDGEQDGDHEGVTREDVPRGGPARNLGDGVGIAVNETVNHELRSKRTDSGTEAVGHHHEHTLRTGTNLGTRLLIHKERATDVEEIERHAIDNHREDEKPHAVARVADSEKAETEHPCEHRHQHHILDTETAQAERNQQDTECFGNLRQRNQDVGVLHGKRVSILLHAGKGGYKGVGVTIGDLQRHTQQHRENEEDTHLLVLEKGECPQTERINKRLFLHILVDGAVGKRQGVKTENDTPCRTDKELAVIMLKTEQIDNPHGADETDGTKYTDGRESLHRVVAASCQRRIGNRIVQGNRRHEKRHTHRIEREKLRKSHLIAVGHTHITSERHKTCRKEVTDTQHFLCRNPVVCHDTDQSRHKQRHNALHRIELSDVHSHAHRSQIGTHAGQIRTPHRKYEEVHHNKSDFQLHNNRFIKFIK